LTGTKLYCLVTEAHVCEQLAQGCYVKAERTGIEPATFQLQVQRPSHYTTTSTRYQAKRLAGKNVFEITYFVSSGTYNLTQSVTTSTHSGLSCEQL